MRRILFIAHYFPPLGGAGVQRAAKFVKYLPEFGVMPVVVTGPGTASGRWSPADESMLDEVPRDVRVYRAAWRSSAGPDDSERLNSLLQVAERAARENTVEAILVSMSPFADARVARELSRRLGLPWAADLRDPWALDEFQVYRSRWHRMREKRRMRHALAEASLIVMNTPEAAARLSTAFTALRGKRVVALTNGYDAADFADTQRTPFHGRFTIVHSGYLHTSAGLHQGAHWLQYRLLGRTEPGMAILTRSHFYLLQAVEQWVAENPEILERIRLLLLGRMSGDDEARVNASAVRAIVRLAGYLSHEESVREIRAADLLFLPMHKLAPGLRATIVPGKTYEYLATGRPILAAVPDGDAKDFIVGAGTGLICDPDDVGGMLAILKKEFEAHRGGARSGNWNGDYVAQFERRRLTEQLAKEMVGLCERVPSIRLH